MRSAPLRDQPGPSTDFGPSHHLDLSFHQTGSLDDHSTTTEATTMAASPQVPTSPLSPDEIFLTPRAGSPFFPTTLSVLSSDSLSMSRSNSKRLSEASKVLSSLEAAHAETSNGSSSFVDAMETPQSRPATRPATPDLPRPGALGLEIHQNVRRPFSESDPTSPFSIDSMDSHSPTKQAFTRPNLRSDLEPMPNSDGTVPATARATEMPISPQWTEQLRQSLIAEGLSETANTADQEIRSLASTLVPAPSEAGQGSALASQDDRSSTVDVIDRGASASSDISRTPSTSTTGTTSSAANSSGSAETTSSSIPSETDPLDVPAGKAAGDFDSSETTPTVPQEKYIQSKLRRYHALLELVETERSYANDLSVLVQIYFSALPLQPYFDDHPARLDTVIRNTPELMLLHGDIATQMEHTLEREGIAASDVGTYAEKALSKGVDTAIVSIATFFKDVEEQLLPYQDFCARHAEALAVIKEAEKRHNGEDFAAFERMCSNVLKSRPSSRSSSYTDLGRLSRRSSFSAPSLGSRSSGATTLSPMTPMPPVPTPTPTAPASSVSVSVSSSPGEPSSSSGPHRQSGKLNFADLLIKPVQRLCLYPLVLHTLLKHTGSEDAGKEELQAALATVKRVADEVDEAGKRREQFLLSELVASRVETRYPVSHALLTSFGSIQLSGTLDVLYHHPTIAPLAAPLRFRFLGLFLYRGWLLITKVRKAATYEPRHWFPLYSAQLSSVEEDEGILPHALRLTIDDDHHFELAASSSRERALWVDALSKAIIAAPPSPEGQGRALTDFPSSLALTTLEFGETSLPSNSPEILSRKRSESEGGIDPLGDFLAQQSTMASSTEVLVRYASMAQRAAVDRGMIFSESILSARAITHRDGTFTPGGSLTKSAPTTPSGGAPTLTSWQAANNVPTSSLGAAVGAAMGLARAAKRSSRQSSTNVFEAAAQQYVAAEESRMAEEARREAQMVYERGDVNGDAEFTQASSPSHKKKRGSVSAKSTLRPMSTFAAVPSVAGAGGSPSASYPDSADGPPLPSPVPGSLSLDVPRTSSTSSSPNRPLRGNLKKRQSTIPNANFLDALSTSAWTKRTRSQSAEAEGTLLQEGGSPMGQLFPRSVDAPPRTTSPLNLYDQQAANGRPSRPSSLKRALTSVTTRRERAQSIGAAASAVAPPSPQRETSDIAEEPDAPAAPEIDPTLGHRRRTSSSFGSSLSLMGPPFGSLRRGLTGRSWKSGSRSASTSRRSSVVDTDAGSSSGYGASTPDLPDVLAALTMSNRSQPNLSRHNWSPLGRSATDTALIPPVPDLASRPGTARSHSSPQSKAGSTEDVGTADEGSPLSRTTTRSTSRTLRGHRDFSSSSTISVSDPTTAVVTAPVTASLSHGLDRGAGTTSKSGAGSLARSISKRFMSNGSSDRRSPSLSSAGPFGSSRRSKDLSLNSGRDGAPSGMPSSMLGLSQKAPYSLPSPLHEENEDHHTSGFFTGFEEILKGHADEQKTS